MLFNQNELLKRNQKNEDASSWTIAACKHRICGIKQLNRGNELVLPALRVLDKIGVQFLDYHTTPKVKVDPQVEKTKRSSPFMNVEKEDKSKNVKKG